MFKVAVRALVAVDLNLTVIVPIPARLAACSAVRLSLKSYRSVLPSVML